MLARDRGAGQAEKEEAERARKREREAARARLVQPRRCLTAQCWEAENWSRCVPRAEWGRTPAPSSTLLHGVRHPMRCRASAWRKRR